MLEIMNTFVQVALDSTTTKAVIPEARGEQNHSDESKRRTRLEPWNGCPCRAPALVAGKHQHNVRGERPNMD